MTTSNDLLNEIRRVLGSAISPSLTTASATNDLFEAYILVTVLEAAQSEGATISYENVHGAVPSVFVFRTSPGHIYSTQHDYTHAIISFPNMPTLEAHIGVRTSGKSGVLHECDVVVLRRDEAETCRRNQVPPRHNRVILSVECKFYTANIPLGLARAFLGYVTDMSASHAVSYFVVNTSSDNAEKLLAHHSKYWEHQITPSSVVDVQRLKNSFQKTFKNYQARR